MNKFFIRYSTGKTVLFLFILSNLFYVAMVAYTIPKVMQFAAGMKLPDMMPAGYDFNYMKTLLTLLGDAGRNVYLTRQIPLDLVYPFLFALGYSLLLAYFLKKLKPAGSALFYLCWLPVIGGIADYLENTGIIILLRSFPDISEQTVQLTSLATVIKSAATTIYFVVLLVVLVVAGIRRLKQKR